MERDDPFKDIDFDKSWGEEEWKQFFEAQDRFMRRTWRFRRPLSSRGAWDPTLSFHRVLRHFGMDPDDPDACLGEFPWEMPQNDEASSSRLKFWEAGAELENLPIYVQARCFAIRVALLFFRRFHKMLGRRYKSCSHRIFQGRVRDFQFYTGRIPRFLAAGHGLGYDPDGVMGNIVRCRTALDYGDVCLGLLTRFPRRALPPEEYRRLFRDAVHLRNNLMEWIDLLRNRFSAHMDR